VCVGSSASYCKGGSYFCSYDYATITTIAGGETQGCSEGGECNENGMCSNAEKSCRKTGDGDGDGGRPIDARLNYPTGLVYVLGGIFFADSRNNRIRKIKLPFHERNGTISHVAGFKNSSAGNGGPNGDPLETGLNNPLSVVVKYETFPNATIFITDTGNHKILKIPVVDGFPQDTYGRISTLVNTDGVPTCIKSEDEVTCKNLESEEGIDASEATLFSPSASRR
jgi:hypothetical protein